MMLEEMWWKGILWSFIHFLHMSRYPGYIRSTFAFCSWNNMVDDERAVPWAKKESLGTKHQRKTCSWWLPFLLRSIYLQLFKNKCATNWSVDVNAYIPRHSLPTPGPSQKNSKHISVKEILSRNWNSNLC